MRALPGSTVNSFGRQHDKGSKSIYIVNGKTEDIIYGRVRKKADAERNED